MSQYDNNMRGIVSKNDRKERDSHPDIKGQCEIDGRQFWISGWRKERKDGTGSFYSLSFEPKDNQAPAQSAHSEAKSNGYQPQDGFDEPF